MPAPSLQRAPRAFAAEVAGRQVVLDLAADRYFLQRLPSSPASRPELGSAVVRDPAATAWVAKAALWPQGAWAWRPAAGALVSIHRISRLLEAPPFERLVEVVRATPVRAGKAGSPVVLLASFEAVRPLYPRPRVCRLDAPALCLLFRAFGHPARLVFGVRLEPFAAHCWAELEGAVLGEPVEKVSPFTPLLLV